MDDAEHDQPNSADPTSDLPVLPSPRRRRTDPDGPFEVKIEFVALGGDAGRALAKRQAEIMRKVLQWIADNPAPADPDAHHDPGTEN